MWGSVFVVKKENLTSLNGGGTVYSVKESFAVTSLKHLELKAREVAANNHGFEVVACVNTKLYKADMPSIQVFATNEQGEVLPE